MSCNIFNSCCWGMLVYFLCILHNNMHSAKIVHEFTASSTVKNDLYRMTKNGVSKGMDANYYQFFSLEEYY